MSTRVHTVQDSIPSWATVCGIVALILAILGFIVPVFGILLIMPVAIIFGAVALYGGAKTMGIAVLVITVVKLIISPTFWLNLAAGAQQGAGANRLVALIEVVGVVAMLYLAVRKRPA